MFMVERDPTLYLARLRGRMTNHAVSGFCSQLSDVIEATRSALPAWEEQARGFAEAMKGANAVLYLGRAIHYAIAREGALKLKESAYVQAEGYPVGELKHGPNALVGKNAPLVVLATRDESDPDSVLRYEKTLQLIRDMHAQGAEIFALISASDTEIPKLTPHTIRIPEASEYLLPVLEVVPTATAGLLQRNPARHRRGQPAQPRQSSRPGVIGSSGRVPIT